MKSLLKWMIALVVLLLPVTSCAQEEEDTPPAVEDTTSTGYAEETGEWVALFNGENFDNWVQLNGQAKYAIEGDEIVGTTVVGEPNSFLATREEYDDFILEFEVKVDTMLNSGVQIRSQSLPEFKDGRVHGYQVEIDPSPRAYSGGIYDEARRGWLQDLSENEAARQAFNPTEWNRFRVEAIGPSIKTWVNGVPAADLEDDMTLSGFIALQVHSTRHPEPLQVRWRNIRLMEL